MVNYTDVWPSAQANASEVARYMAWARWPALGPDRPSRVSPGGIHLGISAHTRHPDLAFEAAACIASEANQWITAGRGGLPPTSAALYQDPGVRRISPLADVLRATLKDAVPRAQIPFGPRTDRARLIARLDPGRRVAEGDRLRLAVAGQDLHLFDGETGLRLGDPRVLGFFHVKSIPVRDLRTPGRVR
jgi:ABC-type glycerol-3-phosphate transport system substrate-binding protein